MPIDTIPDEVKKLIAEHVMSVEQLEILMLLRNRPDVEWTLEAVTEHIRTGPASASRWLADLGSRGFATVRDSTYRYNPATPRLRSAVDGLAAAYAEQRYTVIELIFAKPIENLRVYADAFRIGKGGKGGSDG